MSRYPKSNPRWRMLRGLSTPHLRRIYRASQSAGVGPPGVEQTDYPHVREMIGKILEALNREVEAWNHRQAREHVFDTTRDMSDEDFMRLVEQTKSPPDS